MPHNRTYGTDLNSHQNKKRRKINVCSAINNPDKSFTSGCNAYPATSDLKFRVENLDSANFYLIPVSNAGEGNY